MFEPQPDQRRAPTADPGSRANRRGDAVRPVEGDRPWAAADLGRVRAVIEALPEAVFVTESDGALRLTNPAADRLFASEPVHDRADLLGRFEEVAPAGRARPLGEQLDEAQAHLTVRPRDQPNRWFTLRKVPLDPGLPLVERGLPLGEPPAVPASDLAATPDIAPATDVSPASDMEDVGTTPEGRMVFVLRDVTDSRELRPVREAFLAILSHELRTPITTIYAGSSVLARRGALSPPVSQTLASDISAEAARLYDLVEDLLVLARLERRVLDPLDEPVQVPRAVDATIRTVTDRFGPGLIVRAGDLDAPPVHGDSTYVEQACRNLVMASIRYAEGDEADHLAVEIRVDAAPDEVRVAVLDRGPALAPAELDRAFELPAAGATGRLAATGVGPFVCRHLVEAMGGRVWARNRPTGGLELGFALRIDDRA